MTKAKSPLFNVHFRRRRQGRTNYVKRLALLKSGLSRLVIRKLNKSIIVQLVQFNEKGDKTICQASNKDLEKLGFKPKRNVPSAYLLGFLIGKRARAKGIEKFIADFGLHAASKGGVLFAVVKGALDGGLLSSVQADRLPSEDRVKGKHLGIEIAEVLAKIKEVKS